MGSLSIWHWWVVLAVLVLVFGTKKLRGAGAGLGEAVKGFRKGKGDARPADDAARRASNPPESLASRRLAADHAPG